jgi:hypothetical protein
MAIETLEQLEALAAGLDAHDWTGFAARVSEIDPVVGETVRLHALAADGNSPDVAEWPRHTWDDALDLGVAGIDTVEEAREWWEAKYAG